MRDIDEEWVRTRAYMLWEQSGHVHGHDRDTWEQACREYREMADAADAVTEKSQQRVQSAADAATLTETSR